MRRNPLYFPFLLSERLRSRFQASLQPGGLQTYWGFPTKLSSPQNSLTAGAGALMEIPATLRLMLKSQEQAKARGE